MFFRRKASFPQEKLTVRILADVNDVDPVNEDHHETTQDDAAPTVRLVSNLFIPGVAVQLCLDDGGMLQWLTEADIANWGISQAELFSLAVDNLNSRIPESTLNKLSTEHGEAYTPVCEGVTLSSLILANRLLSDFGFVRENIAAVLPNRDTYYFCDKASSGSLDLLRTVADIAWNDEDCPKKYRITKDVLVADQRAAFGWARLQQPN